MWEAHLSIIILILNGNEGAPLSSCPKSCTCIGTEFHCKSFNFLQAMSGEEATVTTLIVNNSTASSFPKLDAFLNLKTLNLASNKLKQFNTFYFPKNIEKLDLSHNFITTLPRDLNSLIKLKELILTGNPISCTCDSILIRNQLLQNQVSIPSPVKCNSPKKLYGKSWLSVTCLDDSFSNMQGDAPYEGSGFDIPTESKIEATNQDNPLEEEFIRVDSTTEAIRQNQIKSEVINEEEEGSGNSDSTPPLIELEEDDKEDEGYDETTVTETPIVRANDLFLNSIPTCNFDCSTPTPSENDTDELPPPSVFEGAKILWDDFSILKSTDFTANPGEENKVTESSVNKTQKNNAEIVINQIAEQDKGSFVEETKQSNISTYIFLGGLLIIIITLAIYAIYKKQSSERNDNSSNKTDEKPRKVNEHELLNAKSSNGMHEVVPLMNGDNEKEVNPFEDVELREQPNEDTEENLNLLVPQTKRVTIKESEIPNSTPKTPILVTRQLNSDGSIVTVPQKV